MQACPDCLLDRVWFEPAQLQLPQLWQRGKLL
jgi:hypothetical protein